MEQQRSNAKKEDQVGSAKLRGRKSGTNRLGVNGTWVFDRLSIDTREGRMNFDVVVDESTGSVLGWSMNERASTKSAREALRFALRARGAGIPATVQTDSGREFSARQWKALLRDLELSHVVSEPRRATDKGAIEQFFRQFQGGVSGLGWQSPSRDINPHQVVSRPRNVLDEGPSEGFVGPDVSGSSGLQTVLTLESYRTELEKFIVRYNSGCQPCASRGD